MDTKPFVAKFVGHPRHHEWDRAFSDAIERVQSASGMSVLDALELDPDQPAVRSAVLFHVLEAGEVGSPEGDTRILAAADEQDRDRSALGVAAYCEDGHDDVVAAAASILALLGVHPAGLPRWIEGLTTLTDLRDHLAEWMLTLVKRRIPPSAATNEVERILSDELSNDDGGDPNRRLRRIRNVP